MSFSARLPNALHKHRAIARAVACGVLLTLPACRLPTLRHAESGPVLPPGFNVPAGSGSPVSDYPSSLAAVVGGVATAAGGGTVSADNASQIGVEEFYNDPLLTQLILQGLAGNLELRVLNQEVEIARNEILSRQGAFLPFLSFGAGGGLESPSLYTPAGAAEDQLLTPDGNRFPDPLWNTRAGLNFSWQLDIWRQLRKARDAARLRYAAALEKRNYFVTKMVAEIAENYYGLMALDKRLENLDKTIELQQQSLGIAQRLMAAGRGTELSVQRFTAEVRKNQSEKLVINQEIIEVENRINVLVNRYPEPVARASDRFIDLNFRTLTVGIPSQLLLNRPDIRQAEFELAAAGLDVTIARANFYPSVTISAGLGYEAFNPKYIFRPEAFAANVAGDLVAPLVNRRAIQAEYLNANARQLQSIYNYQRVVLTAFTEVINRVNMVENYRQSIEIKNQQLASLEASVDVAGKIFQNPRVDNRVEYLEVLLAQRDLRDARMVLIDTKRQQLAAVANAYQALGGGNLTRDMVPEPPVLRGPTIFSYMRDVFR